ncbi:MAG: hypothetical protein ACRERU_12680 [Methylococcales bacterium]
METIGSNHANIVEVDAKSRDRVTVAVGKSGYHLAGLQIALPTLEGRPALPFTHK